MRRSYKQWVVGGLLLTFMLASGPVMAGTIASVIAKVNSEYVAGNITDVVFRDNMILILNNAEAATDCNEQEALMESFRIAIGASLNEELNQIAHDNILSEASGVGNCP